MSGARLEAWITEQRRLVELGGRTVASFYLEGPDGKTWGTWPAQVDDLPKLAADATRSLEGSLPSGQTHSARWVALDNEGHQLACLPITMRGQSNEAAGAARDALAFTRATSNHMLATEQLVTILTNQNRFLAAQLEDALQDVVELREALAQRTEANRDHDIEVQKAIASEQRMNAALEELKPLLGVAGALIGERMQAYFEEHMNGKPKRKPRKRGPATPESDGAGPSQSTPEVRAALHAEESTSTEGASSGSNGARAAGANGHAAKRARKTRAATTRSGAAKARPKKSAKAAPRRTKRTTSNQPKGKRA